MMFEKFISIFKVFNLSLLLQIIIQQEILFNSAQCADVNSNIDKSTEVTEPIVTTKLGMVKGKYLKLRVNITEDETTRMVAAYIGIPYAQPPIGDRRFTAPIPLSEQWNAIYDATISKSRCIQMNSTKMSEDCLYVSIWQPLNATCFNSNNCSILIYIHGMFNGGTIYNDKIQAEYLSAIGEVIVVHVAFRHGVFGGGLYLPLDGEDETGDKGIQSNIHLRDLITGIQWVKENIRSFSGNPNKITIIGHSAGATRIQALILSPATRGLFQRAIMLSAPHVDIFLTHHSFVLKRSIKLATQMNCVDTQNNSIIINCLRKIPAHKLLEAASKILINEKETSTFIYGDDILPYEPFVAFEKRIFNDQLDLLIGSVDQETQDYKLNSFIDTEKNLTEIINNSFEMNITEAENYLKRIFEYYNIRDNEKLFLESMKFYFLKYENLNSNSNRSKTIDQLLKVNDDFRLVCPSILFGKGLATTKSSINNVFKYHLSGYPGKHFITNCSTKDITCHADDLIYLFGTPFKTPENFPHDEDRQMSIKFIKMISQFTNDGNIKSFDGIEWKPMFERKQVNTKMDSFEYNVRMMVLNQTSYFNDSSNLVCQELWKTNIYVKHI